MAPQYAQKFREEWMKDKNFKEWIVELDNDNTKHLETTKNFSASRALTTFIKPITTKTAQAESAICLFISAHSSVLSCDHLGELCKNCVKSSETADSMKLHRTKCTGIICNVLAPHFKNELKNKINNGPFSILIDESTDMSVHKFLGITIMYFDTDMRQVTSTYLSLVEMESCDAEALVNAVKTILHCKVNKNDAINGFRQIIDDQTVSFKNVMPEFYNLVQTFPCSTAECERGFSLMNNICTKLRSTLTIKHLANLMFINVNGPPLDEWEPKNYEPETREEKKSIWKIL
ncbi:unnamed protein product [Macrosiphum euphorbiae]|uniref:HAT C-terminal dimerisation domain-containing protein n=1 Tax=Macrosiphum euphorbiae TaxID=13131 RepID=A0AAV0Y9V3_9HEMI|nr:unnamed protein product [Macrosiphum euphorbiae]